MNVSNLTEKSRSAVQAVFVDVLGVDPGVDWSTVKYQEVDGWDSLAHMAIVADLEERFGIMLDVDDVLDMSSYERALEILAEYGVDTTA
ncbi:MAG TPA: acyl carrier protein [Acidimicrobiia bacterium]|nr:acyl carrier protein [Acidimicrobiia bacterium]